MQVVPIVAATAADALAQIPAIRSRGDVPLVIDDRWPADHRSAILSTASGVELPEGAAWATATSGSSGAPRIVLRAEESWAASFSTVGQLLGAKPSDCILLPAPPSSSLTLFSVAHALAGGPQPATDASLLHGTPQALRAALDSAAHPGLRAALIGGSHLDPALRARAAAAGIAVTTYYGAAELSFVAVDTGDGLRPFPGVEIRVENEEIWVRSPYVALGYLGSDGPLKRDGEWATVGDRAELVDGRLRLLGRDDDAILSASATIVPEEVEAVLRSVPGVIDAIVFGWPRPNVGALVAAVVEGQPDLALLKSTCQQRLAPAHRPRLWFTGTLPRTASGKPARALAAQLAIAGEMERIDAHE